MPTSQLVSKLEEHGTMEDRLKQHCRRNKSHSVNRYNAITWATQNPHVYITQKKAGVMLWVGLIKDNIIGPFMFDSSVTGDVYLNLLKRSLWPALRALMGDEIDPVNFQQDGASAHYSKVARRWLDLLRKMDWKSWTNTMASKKSRPITFRLLAVGLP
eukprot:Em0023g962a